MSRIRRALGTLVAIGAALTAVTAPASASAEPAAPLVSSAVYTENAPYPGVGGEHVPGVFSFDANGVADVVEFRYANRRLSGSVPADADGKATAVITPGAPGSLELKVYSVNRDGVASAVRTYDTQVAYTGPDTTVTPWSALVGTPRTATFAPRWSHLGPIVRYTYRVNEGEPVTVDADAAGRASMTIGSDRPGLNEVRVFGVTADGTRTAEHLRSYEAVLGYAWAHSPDYPYETEAGGVGVTGAFELHSTVPETVAFEYLFEDGEVRTVAAEAPGTAVISLTPTRAGRTEVLVRSVRADGLGSNWYAYRFGVAS
ncbi:hypothetical protein AB0A74_10595 [Saccharothrix sp. NPDC042600]|uniref:hypothetical protein n=1 Tax=Saccharothrix TaxID=2071 RepID=UPI00340EAF33|nr:hypothetical protein GCM10017745_08690 [Saccharothrix mutabilis subsp. capreolus]